MLLTQLVQAFACEERDYAENITANWASLGVVRVACQGLRAG